MDDWISFEGRIVPMAWGESTFTILPIPNDVDEILVAQHARRIEIELNDHPYNLALTKAPAFGQRFVYTGKTLLQATGIEPGDPIDVRLRKADPDFVEVPDDVLLALKQNELSDVWEALSPGKRRGLLHTIATAKRAATRQARIAKLMRAIRP